MSDNEIHFVTSKGSDAKTATLYNMQGRLVVNIHTTKSGYFVINRKNLKPGVWIVRVGEQKVKFLIE
jgi:hypothetical protein